MPHFPDEIQYSEKYQDNVYEYRHVTLTKAVAVELLKISEGKRLLKEDEWRGLGVQGSAGWCHYMCFPPEPHILLLRRPLEEASQQAKSNVR